MAQSKCIFCKTKFGQKIFNYRYCESTPECLAAGKEFQLNARIKSALNKVRSDKKEKFAVMKENVTDYKKFLQDDVQKIAKLIDYGLRGLHETPQDTGQIQGGHIYTKKSHEQMRFNLHNIHRQGAKSNMALIYDEEIKDALKLEYGIEYFEFIKSLKQQPLPKIKQNEYKEYHFKALAIIKRLELTFTHYSKNERLELRNAINDELGIYSKQYTQFNIKS